MSKTTIIIIVVVIIGLLGTAFVLGPGSKSDDAKSAQTEDTSEGLLDKNDSEEIGEDIDKDITDSDVAEELDISMTHFAFSIDKIKAKPGDTIRINLVSDEGNHDFVIDELNVASDILSAGESQTFEFTIPPDAAGKTFEFYCSVGSHRAQGMVGELEVEG